MPQHQALGHFGISKSGRGERIIRETEEEEPVWQTPGECRSEKSEKKASKETGMATELKAAEDSLKLRTKERPMIGQGRGHLPWYQTVPVERYGNR